MILRHWYVTLMAGAILGSAIASHNPGTLQADCWVFWLAFSIDSRSNGSTAGTARR
jgi:hypothetical protein